MSYIPKEENELVEKKLLDDISSWTIRSPRLFIYKNNVFELIAGPTPQPVFCVSSREPSMELFHFTSKSVRDALSDKYKESTIESALAGLKYSGLLD